MSSLVQLLPLVGIWLVVLASPGPDFVVTVQYATSRSRRDGVLVGLGVTSAIAVWATSSLFGLAAVLAQVSWLYDSVRIAGTAYLGYLGIRALLAVRKGGESARPAVVQVTERSGWKVWRVGFLTNIANPKAAVFFGSLFTAVLPAHPAVWLQGITLAVMLTMAAGWFTVVACLFSLSTIAAGYRRARRVIDAVTGCVFLALAGKLAVD